MRPLLRRALLSSVVLAAAISLTYCSSTPFTFSSGTGGSQGHGGAGGGGTGGSSTCDAALTRCGSACADTTSDPAHCGACDVACDTGAACCTGICVATASCAFAVTESSPPTGWLNGGDYVTLKGSGFVVGMRVFIGDGRAAVLVQSPSLALIKTPPGPLGPADLKIQLGTTTATLKLGFKYQDAGLTTPWEQKPMMTVRGEDPGVAVMQDGRVLIAGGTKVPDSTPDALATAEIYTRTTDMVVSAASTMGAPRWQNSAVTLLSGKVLVVGGACFPDLTKCNGDPAVADLLDPATNMFSQTKSKLLVGRSYTRNVLLPDGRVLIASANDPSLEIYDPIADAFTLVPAKQAHIFGFLVLLRDGRALLGGGDGGVTAAEVFDPDTNMLTSVGSLQHGRSKLSAHTLPDGRVLVIGGSSLSAGGINDPLDSMEAFDPVTNKFTELPYKLTIGRTWHASALVRDGTVLVMGGYTIPKQCSSLSATVDQVNPVTGTVVPFAVLPNANTEWDAVTLLDGSVLGVGGGACGTAMALPDIDFLPGAVVPH